MSIAHQPPALSLQGLTKSFGGTTACEQISLQISAGSVHALLGENGAGKSTMLKLISGALAPDSGRILLNGEPTRFRSPEEGRRAGIGVVHQNFSLVPSLSVRDNVILGDRRVPFFLSRRALGVRIEAKAAELGFSFNLRALVGDLSVAERQKLEIFKLLWRDARILLLDEPTSQLAPFEAEDVLAKIGELAATGRTIVLVSHFIEEVLQHADSVSVLRGGRCISTVDSASTTVDQLARLMVGQAMPRPSLPQPCATASTSLVSLNGVSVKAQRGRSGLQDVSLEILRGEVLGIAGVENSGRNELAAVLSGQLVPSNGTLRLNGEKRPWSALRAPSERAAHVPADPRNHGTAPTLSVLDNLFLGDTHQSRFRIGPFLRPSVMRKEAYERIKLLNVQPANVELPSGALSGGNLQRLTVSRELSLGSMLLVAENPCAGMDFAATELVRAQLREYASEERAVILVSYSLDELLQSCDRIAVFHNGKLVGNAPTSSVNSDWVGLLMGGVSADVVDVLLRPGADEDAIPAQRSAILDLLGSTSVWHRRLGAQVALRVLQARDQKTVEGLLRRELNDGVQAWLTILLAHLSHEDHLENLGERFKENPAPFVEAQRHLLGVSDRMSMRPALSRPISDRTSPWRRTLAELTLEHIGDDGGANT